MKVTMDLLMKGSSQKKMISETAEEFLKKVTHMSLFGWGITDMEEVSRCRHVSVLYLYDNHISELKSIALLPNLTRLYLQNNDISDIQPLSGLQQLEILYLNENRISRIHGLDPLPRLVELHLDHQKLEPNSSLSLDQNWEDFDSLRTFSAVANRIHHIASLASIHSLETLNLTHNNIADWEELRPVLSSCQQLKNMSIQENPICSQSPKWKHWVIATSHSIEVLNQKEIRDSERRFLKWKNMSKEEGWNKGISVPSATTNVVYASVNPYGDRSLTTTEHASASTSTATTFASSQAWIPTPGPPKVYPFKKYPKRQTLIKQGSRANAPTTSSSSTSATLGSPSESLDLNHSTATSQPIMAAQSIPSPPMEKGSPLPFLSFSSSPVPVETSSTELVSKPFHESMMVQDISGSKMVVVKQIR